MRSLHIVQDAPLRVSHWPASLALLDATYRRVDLLARRSGNARAPRIAAAVAEMIEAVETFAGTERGPRVADDPLIPALGDPPWLAIRAELARAGDAIWRAGVRSGDRRAQELATAFRQMASALEGPAVTAPGPTSDA